MIINNQQHKSYLILFALLFAYKSKLIKATENFKLGITAATGGLCLFYFISFAYI